MTLSAAALAQTLKTAARQYGGDEISYEEWSAINRRTWDGVDAAGLKRTVQAILRKALS